MIFNFLLLNIIGLSVNIFILFKSSKNFVVDALAILISLILIKFFTKIKFRNLFFRIRYLKFK